MNLSSTRIVAVVAAIASLALTGCEAGREKQMAGTVIGGALGGWAGSQIGGGSGQLAATAAGTLLGALIGSEIGKSMDELDRIKAQQATQQALEYNQTGQVTQWSNPDSGHSGTVTPTRNYQTNEGQYCREFQQTVEIGGQTQQAYGTACRQPDGSWKIVS